MKPKDDDIMNSVRSTGNIADLIYRTDEIIKSFFYELFYFLN